MKNWKITKFVQATLLTAMLTMLATNVAWAGVVKKNANADNTDAVTGPGVVQEAPSEVNEATETANDVTTGIILSFDPTAAATVAATAEAAQVAPETAQTTAEPTETTQAQAAPEEISDFADTVVPPEDSTAQALTAEPASADETVAPTSDDTTETTGAPAYDTAGPDPYADETFEEYQARMETGGYADETLTAADLLKPLDIAPGVTYGGVKQPKKEIVPVWERPDTLDITVYDDGTFIIENAGIAFDEDEDETETDKADITIQRTSRALPADKNLGLPVCVFVKEIRIRAKEETYASIGLQSSIFPSDAEDGGAYFLVYDEVEKAFINGCTVYDGGPGEVVVETGVKLREGSNRFTLYFGRDTSYSLNALLIDDVVTDYLELIW
ncbi:MAG: hypothetical protein LBR77_09735 [Lachnospiraceae bacterium]|jgi:hypothetical protein|nr:hypothetical protein [Lachnospiraceae bacterium]